MGMPMRAGSMGDCGCFSFFPSKNLGGSGDGGMVTTHTAEAAEKLKVLRAHGSKPKYYHRLVGGNFRLDAIQAAVLLVKLKYLDEWTAKRRQNASYYNFLFEQSGIMDQGFIIPPQAVWENSKFEIRNSKLVGHVYNQYVIRAKDRDELRICLKEQSIGTEIYYPLPLHQQECFAGLGYKAGDFVESEKAAAETLALPIYPELEPVQQEYVVEKIHAFYAA
jgi:dTDP-4-amino-4,6-dideoxygalactose transaminase